MRTCEEATNSSNSIRIILTRAGVCYTISGDLPETAIKADGPMSLESGVMGLVRELCQKIHNDMREAV